MPLPELRERLRNHLRDHHLYSAEVGTVGKRHRLLEAGRNVAVGLGATSFLGTPVQFVYRGYKIPLDLAEMTGGADETWEEIALAHMDYYRRWSPIDPDDSILEIGCGIGRDAIHLAGVLSSSGRYAGVDVSEPSIAWCRHNISKRHPNFDFVALDVRSPMYNPNGTSSNTDVVFPFSDETFDTVVLHSVFTHMFAPDISHYVSEISRVMRHGATMLASFFVVDDETLASADEEDGPLTFRHSLEPGCRVNDVDHPEAAVAFELSEIEQIASNSGLEVTGLHRGAWSGLHPDAPNGQDILIFERS